MSYVLRHENETILVVANLSRFIQPVELDLRSYSGSKMVEMFGGNEFPAIAERPYLLTLGPHAFYWFTLEPGETVSESTGSRSGEQRQRPIRIPSFDDVFTDSVQTTLARLLPSFLRSRP